MSGIMRKISRILIRAAGVVALTVFLFVWCFLGWWPIPSFKGHFDACNDITHGRYRELAWGMPFGGADIYTRILRERYGIDFHYEDFCTASMTTRKYVAAYDEVSSIAIKNKFGRDVLKEAYDEAVKDWKLTHPINSVK